MFKVQAFIRNHWWTLLISDSPWTCRRDIRQKQRFGNISCPFRILAPKERNHARA